MRIISAKIDWMKGYGNLPELKVTVDLMPRRENLAFKTRGNGDGSTTYWATEGDFVTFFTHVPGDQTGFGGHTFKVNLEDGSTVDVKGPWSDNAMNVNAYFPPSHNCAYYETEGRYPDLGFAAHISMTKAIELITGLDADYSFIKQYGGRNNEMCVTDTVLIESLAEKIMLHQPIGHYDIAIRLKRMTLEESQEAKNK